MSRPGNAQFLHQFRRAGGEDAVTLLRLVIDRLRPRRGEVAGDGFRRQLAEFAALLAEEPEVAETLAASVGEWLARQDLRLALAQGGLLPRRGFIHELMRRGYDSINPPAANPRDLGDSLRRIFHQPDDARWVPEIDDAAWLSLFSLLLGSRDAVPALPMDWQGQVLDALEKLAVWVAAEETEGELVRLDPKALDRQSPFSALQREVAAYVAGRQAARAGSRADCQDAAHIHVLLDQSRRALAQYRKRSLARGASIGLTYMLERLGQTLQRIHDLLDLLEPGRCAAHAAALRLFRQLAVASVQRNSLRALWRQSIGLLSRKVSDNASEHGEHYVTRDRRGYLKMFASAAGAGLVVPVMALLKLKIAAAGFAPLLSALLQSLNYGLGFVLIHMLGFTIATKQPAMTAAHIANAMERDSRSRARPDALVELAAQVARSQFVAIVGNVGVALAVALGIAWAWQAWQGHALLLPGKSAALLHGLHPFAGLALLHAAIAGVWLFCSGLIAGYFDNRFDLLGLRERFIAHPLWRSILPRRLRERVGDWLAIHYGALWGNFLFGVLLGSTAFVGFLLGLPIDIRHVTFSAANLGFAGNLHWMDFLVFLGFVLMIGLVNLAVSFSLALMVGLRARGLSMPDPLRIFRALAGKLMVAPWEFVLPPRDGAQIPAGSGGKEPTTGQRPETRADGE